VVWIGAAIVLVMASIVHAWLERRRFLTLRPVNTARSFGTTSQTKSRNKFGIKPEAGSVARKRKGGGIVELIVLYLLVSGSVSVLVLSRGPIPDLDALNLDQTLIRLVSQSLIALLMVAAGYLAARGALSGFALLLLVLGAAIGCGLLTLVDPLLGAFGFWFSADLYPLATIAALLIVLPSSEERPWRLAAVLLGLAQSDLVLSAAYEFFPVNYGSDTDVMARLFPLMLFGAILAPLMGFISAAAFDPDKAEGNLKVALADKRPNIVLLALTAIEAMATIRFYQMNSDGGGYDIYYVYIAASSWGTVILIFTSAFMITRNWFRAKTLCTAFVVAASCFWLMSLTFEQEQALMLGLSCAAAQAAVFPMITLLVRQIGPNIWSVVGYGLALIAIRVMISLFGEPIEANGLALPIAAAMAVLALACLYLDPKRLPFFRGRAGIG